MGHSTIHAAPPATFVAHRPTPRAMVSLTDTVLARIPLEATSTFAFLSPTDCVIANLYSSEPPSSMKIAAPIYDAESGLTTDVIQSPNIMVTRVTKAFIVAIMMFPKVLIDLMCYRGML